MAFKSSSEYDLVICDIDGCMSPESHALINLPGLSQVAEHNRKAIAQKDRPLVTLCSGRPIGFVECMCRLLQNSLVPCIGENGVWLWNPSDNVFECDPTITDEHFEMVHEARKLIRDRYAAQGVVQQPGKSASIALYHPDTEYLRSILPELGEEFQRRGWAIRVSMTWFYINCDLEHISKGTAIDRLLTKTGIAKERIAGIGDTMGDRYIADRVAWFGCPGNAEDEIKQRAHFVSEREEVEGVLDILSQLTSG